MATFSATRLLRLCHFAAQWCLAEPNYHRCRTKSFRGLNPACSSVLVMTCIRTLSNHNKEQTYHLLYLQFRKPLKMSLKEPTWWRLSRTMTTGRSALLLSALHCSARLARYCCTSLKKTEADATNQMVLFLHPHIYTSSVKTGGKLFPPPPHPHSSLITFLWCPSGSEAWNQIVATPRLFLKKTKPWRPSSLTQWTTMGSQTRQDVVKPRTKKALII